MNRQQPARLLTTSARVYPSSLPHLYQASHKSSKGLKWLPPLVGIAAIGYGISTYREAQMQRRVAAMEQAELERQRRANMLADAYGDRGSLEELERAVRAYEAQQRQ
ncbi:hypothetical protein NEUTE1DRAFT_116469 [Neurospora tetrasperma FGSC 2508]|uniref:Uncharacterized protein n=2 Tax=Neurospora TaxID=5140 RepID=A0AAJ0I2J2_9PEZI|nr:uncharacterized protein NEUTE1DRAFT_116469 [Neurospora tetrasperma FGSC 2508]EGO59291.1 hypothetical protein NEUTE1DRAFT_116469 [Neurospora tetrasperma FGSC 2508]EGZ73412.1 hypothetical protein NEUTE2DRAFT_144164 [Neurospora tetrasperma FGSC 2509]KAK3487946.1 hypothetical protein B0T23DRAFT_218582 [Neurospora hispaniola]